MKKRVEWNIDKAKQLKKELCIDIKLISVMIEDGKFLDIREVPSRPNQKMFILDYGDYIICVPFVEDDQKIFIKTAYRNRKTNKLYKDFNDE